MPAIFLDGSIVPGYDEDGFFLLPKNIEDECTTELDADIRDYIIPYDVRFKHLTKANVLNNGVYLDPQYYYNTIQHQILYIVVLYKGYYRTVQTYIDANNRRYSLLRMWNPVLISNNDLIFVKVFHDEIIDLNTV